MVTFNARAFACLALAATSLAGATACTPPPPSDHIRVSGQVEATDTRVAALVGGRVVTATAAEGDTVAAGATLLTLDTSDTELALTRARADRAQAEAQVRLVQAAARPEDVRQAESQVEAARAETAALASELRAATADVERFEGLLSSSAGSRKQRDDAVARRDVVRDRHQASAQRVNASLEAVARLKAGARKEEVDAARSRVVAADAQIAIIEKSLRDAVIVAPSKGTITQRLIEPGELVQPRQPLYVIADLERVWANVYVSEPDVPRLRVGQAASLFTDAGGTAIAGTVVLIASQAEFTPRNVQTADDRSKLVYRVKIAADNAAGILKIGMPIEAELSVAP